MRASGGYCQGACEGNVGQAVWHRQGDKQGEANIMGDMENLGILKDAKQNAVVFFQTLLAGAGFDNVVINFKEQKEA